jgi:cell division protein FtsL
VVDRRASAARSVHRQARLLRTLGVGFVVGALALTAAAHTFVASYQQNIDALQAELTQSVAQQQNLQISRAQLESPVRVLSIAEHNLDMVAPGAVSYLAPVNPGPSVEQVGSQAKTVAGVEASRAARSATAAHGSKSGPSATRGSTGGRSSVISPTG